MADTPLAEGGTNWLLASLPVADSRRLLRTLEPVSLILGKVLHDAGQAISHVYFPCSGLVSLLTPLGGGKAVEVGIIGREGMIGLSAFLGGGDAPFHAVVQGTGIALRLAADSLREAVRRSRPLSGLLMRYADAFLVQISQVAACRSLHPLAKRYCHWLLMAHDRIGLDYLPFNQKFLALMLAVRLASVSEAASTLRDAGLIRYTRKGIQILDRLGLEATCCPCYKVIKDRFDRLRV